MARGTTIYAAGLGMALLVAGCSVSPLVKNASKFATAATAASKDATNAYQLVEQEHYNAEVERLVTDFGTANFDLNSIQPFMKPDEMEARTKLIKGLSEYAEALAAVAGDQPLTDFDTQAEAVGKSLKDLSTSDALASMVKKANIDTAGLNAVTTAVDALGRAIINHQRSSELPALLKEAKTPIATICTLLQADIGNSEKSGLRNQLKNDYLTEIEKQEKFIKNTPTLSPTDRQAAIRALATLAKAARDGDNTLTATQKELADLAKTNAALAETDKSKDSPAFKTMLSELVSDTQQLSGFYEKLPTK
ncbi:MAG: hypothetical protein ACLQGT_03085 [Terracidiphilus sp.]